MKLNKTNKKLQQQVKQMVKRRLSSSSDEELELEILKKKLKDTEEELEKVKALTQETASKSPSQNVLDACSDSDDDTQLYGANFEEKMVSIGNDIYCRKIIYDMAMGSSHRASHVARKLLEGVFKRETILKATLTGQPPRAQGLVRQLEPVLPLSYKARAAIIDFAMKVSKERGWSTQTTKEVERAMSQRLGEIKRQKPNTND